MSEIKISPHWRVRFETKDGAYHPIWFGEESGPDITIEDVKCASNTYLFKNRRWLKRIDCIDPFTPVTPPTPHE